MLVVFLVVAALVSLVAGKILVDPKTLAFKDDNQRTIIFHGVNAVYKIAPYYPTTTGFDSTTTLSDEDSKNLKSWGFNIVRLGVMWPGLEPGARGQYSQEYLDAIETIVLSLQKQNIYVILDLHQDIWHRKFCGEGVPDYVYETCKSQEPATTAAFPLPAVNESYPLDSDGNPALDSCLSHMFATYYLSAEVGAGFQCLYDNVDNLWDAMAGYWVTVANRFKGVSNVLGYELLNEPWAGDVYKNPKSLLPHYAEQKFLQPLYQHLHTAIRGVDDQKIIFFEGLTIDYWPNGFTASPGPAEYNDRQVLAYHIYCPISKEDPKIFLACDLIDNEFFVMRQKDSERLGVGLMMTEFGAAQDLRSDLTKMTSLLAMADRHQQSWMYWQFKYFQDITTCTPEGESLYTANGTVSEHKLQVLSRTYPQATAGKLVEYNYHVETRGFSMSFEPLAADAYGSSTTTATKTEIYVNREMSYPHGFNVQVTSETVSDVSSEYFSVQCPTLRDQTHVTLTQTKAVPEATAVKVEISGCRLLEKEACTCK